MHVTWGLLCIGRVWMGQIWGAIESSNSRRFILTVLLTVVMHVIQQHFLRLFAKVNKDAARIGSTVEALVVAAAPSLRLHAATTGQHGCRLSRAA
jgi:hypothetical protein